jgi:pimeloyl-ACP methyl ester carboxylesterase
MTGNDEPTLTRAISRDGTEIGYWTSGRGPPLLLVHGGLGDHTRWDVLRPHLVPHFTVHAVHLRGRGPSADAADYDLAREYEDIAAVVDAIAADSGSSVDVYCSSYGGLCTFGAVRLTSNIGKLVLYEAWPLVHRDSSSSTTTPSTPAVLRPALSCVTRRTETSTFARDRSIRRCRLRTRLWFASFAAVKIRCLNARTSASTFDQTMSGHSRSVRLRVCSPKRLTSPAVPCASAPSVHDSPGSRQPGFPSRHFEPP